MPYTPSDSRYARTPWFRRCGRSGLMLPAISLGLWHNFGAAGTDAGHHDDEQAFHENCRQMLFTAFDQGITHFDLANNYGPPAGAAEERFGRILADDLRPYRDELILSTKAGYWMWPGPYGEWGSRKYLLASLDASLKRMKVDYVDIFYSHRPDPNTPLDETMAALDQAVRSGKAIYAGISSYSGAMTSQAMLACAQEGLTKPIIHQPSYSMFDRWIEGDLLPTVQRLGIGVICFCPLAQGLLTDKYLKGVPADSRASTKSGFLKADRVTPETVAKIAKLNAIAQRRGQSLAQMALAWVLRHASVTTALIGASRPQQILDNVKCLDAGPLSEQDLKDIETALTKG